jgi:hypothetical protein
MVPITETMAAASGPPRIMDAKMGADPTETTLPRGNLTGIALATSVARVQKTSPSGPPTSWRTGNRKEAAAITTTAAATVARMRRLTLVFTGVLRASARAGVYHAPLPASNPGSARDSERNKCAKS